MEKRGSQRTLELKIRHDLRPALPEAEVVRAIGVESKRRGTDKLTASRLIRSSWQHADLRGYKPFADRGLQTWSSSRQSAPVTSSRSSRLICFS